MTREELCESFRKGFTLTDDLPKEYAGEEASKPECFETYGLSRYCSIHKCFLKCDDRADCLMCKLCSFNEPCRTGTERWMKAQAYKAKRSLLSQGENNGRHKLTEREVRVIRRLCRDYGLREVDLSRIYDVSATTINNIINRRRWTHI